MPNRRSFGSIDRLASGRWRVRYRDGDGRRHTAGPFAAKADASRFLATAEADLLRGDSRDPALISVPFVEFAEEWSRTIVHLAPKTRAEYAMQRQQQSRRPGSFCRSSSPLPSRQGHSRGIRATA